MSEALRNLSRDDLKLAAGLDVQDASLHLRVSVYDRDHVVFPGEFVADVVNEPGGFVPAAEHEQDAVLPHDRAHDSAGLFA